ncbi:MAG: DUF4781 domain-containing protein, partial [Casimicrobium sp.]
MNQTQLSQLQRGGRVVANTNGGAQAPVAVNATGAARTTKVAKDATAAGQGEVATSRLADQRLAQGGGTGVGGGLYGGEIEVPAGGVRGWVDDVKGKFGNWVHDTKERFNDATQPAPIDVKEESFHLTGESIPRGNQDRFYNDQLGKAVREQVRPALEPYVAGKDRLLALKGEQRTRFIGAALHEQPSEAAAAKGELRYEGAARTRIDRLDDALKRASNSGEPKLTVVPVFVRTDRRNPLELIVKPEFSNVPLFRVEREGGGERYVDGEGNIYKNLNHWKQTNPLPPTDVIIPKDGRIGTNGASDKAKPLELEMFSNERLDNQALQAAKTTTYAVGALAGGASLVVGGTAMSPLLLTAGVVAGADGLGQMKTLVDHQRPVSMSDAQWRDALLTTASSGLSLGGSGLKQLASGSAGAAKWAQGAEGAEALTELVQTGDSARQFAQQYEKMTPGERVAMAAQIGFFGTLATGSSIHSAKNTHAAIKGTTQTSTPPTKTTTSNPRAETSGTTTKSDAVTPRNNESATDFAERAGIPRSTERSTLDAAERAGLVMSSEGNSQPLLEGSHNLDVVDTPPGVTRSGKPRPGNTRNVDDWGPRQVTIGQAQKLALDNIAANQRTYSAADLSRLTHIFKGGYVVRVMQQDSSAPHAMHKETAAAVVTPNFNGKTKESGVAYLSNVYTQLPGGGEMATKRALEISKTLNQELVGYTTGVKARDLYIDLGARIESVEPHYKKIRAAVTEDPSLTTKIDPRIRDILRSGVNPQGQLTELARTNPEPFFDLPDECASYHFRFGRQPLLEGSGNSNVVVTSPKPGSNGDLRPVNTRNVDQWVPGQLTDGQAKQLASDNIAANPRSYSAEDLKRLTEIFKGGHVVRITQKGVDAPHGAPLRETAAAVVTPNFNGSAKQDGVAYLSNVYTQLPGAGEMATVKAIETAKSLRQDLVGYTTGPQARDLYIKLGAQIESVVPRYEKIRESLVNDPAVAATIDPSIKQIIEHGTEPEPHLEALAKSNPAIFFNLPEGAVSYYFRFGTGQHASGSVGAARNGFLNESNAPQQPSVIELPKPLPKLSAQDSLQLRALATTPENQALIDELLLQKNIGS